MNEDSRKVYRGKPIEDTGSGLYFLIASDPPYAGLVWRQVPDYWTIEDLKDADLDGATMLTKQDLA